MKPRTDRVRFPRIRRTLTVTKKEFIHIKRDKPSLIISFLMPIMMLMIFGFAINTDVNNVDLAVYDASRTQLSREITSSFVQTDYFELKTYVDSVDALEEMIMTGDVKVGIIIPKDYSRNLKRGTSSEIQVLVDGSDPTIARTAVSYTQAIAAAYTSDYRINQLSGIGGAMQGSTISAVPMFLYNPSLESAKFNIPGVVGLILQNITIILTALAMVREKELGTMEQLIMTPVTSIELIIGKLIPYICIGIYDFTVVLIISHLLFGVKVQGNMIEMVVLGIIFLVGSLATGMLISTIARNQAQAIQGTLAFFLPSVMLSGFMFPREAMPLPIQGMSSLIPMTHFLVIIRAIMVKGATVAQLMEATLALLGLLGVLIAATALKFRKKLD